MKINVLMKQLFAGVALVAGMFLAGCEDAPPNNYIPQYVVQGYLVVDEPIDGIVLTRSQPVTDTFKVAKGAVPDASVRIVAGGQAHTLVYRASEQGVGEYYLPDTSVRVKPKTLYRLEITAADGATMTAETMTPDRFDWVRRPRDTAKIPRRNDPAYLNPPDSLSLEWTNTAGVIEYLLRVSALDTAEYGKYLRPPTGQKNKRVDEELDEQIERHYVETSRWGFVAGTAVPIVWAAFKWYGPQEVTIYAADRNMVNWFKMTQWTGNAQFDPLLGNVHGEGIGIFGSASAIRSNTFMLMNEP